MCLLELKHDLFGLSLYYQNFNDIYLYTVFTRKDLGPPNTDYVESEKIVK